MLNPVLEYLRLSFLPARNLAEPKPPLLPYHNMKRCNRANLRAFPARSLLRYAVNKSLSSRQGFFASIYTSACTNGLPHPLGICDTALEPANRRRIFTSGGYNNPLIT